MKVCWCDISNLEVAEKLYNEGYLSYPRTETAGFADDFDLHTLVRQQTAHPSWGNYANSLVNEGKFFRPRKGKGDDKSHPPIHPTKSGESLNGIEAKIYEFVARHFLACCSADASVCGTITVSEEIRGKKLT